MGLGNRGTGETDEFQGSENTLYNTIMIDICHYTFAQTHRVKCDASHGLEVIMMCQF